MTSIQYLVYSILGKHERGKRMKIPDLSYMQVVYLAVLHGLGKSEGEELRKTIKECGFTGLPTEPDPSFYQLMGRMEKAGLIVGSSLQYMRDRQVIRERQYKISALGTESLHKTCGFFKAVLQCDKAKFASKEPEKEEDWYRTKSTSF